MNGLPLFLSVCACVVFSGSYLVAADAGVPPTGDIPDWLKSVGIGAGILGGPLFAVWYAWYVTTRVIPDKEKTHASQLKEAQDQHAEYIKESNRVHADHVNLLTTNYRADLAEMWKTKREDDRAVVDAIKELGGKLTCRYSTP